MQVVDLPLNAIVAATWNPNAMDPAMRQRLRRSIECFELVAPLVVRAVEDARYETIGGAQRLAVLRELGVRSVPCVVVHGDDTEARLLAQALNRIGGEDDLGLRAELVRQVLESLPEDEVLAVLPETADSLQALASLGQEEMAGHLKSWQKAQAARLKHLQLQLTDAQLEVVEGALSRFLGEAKELRGDSPNVRGTALYLLCKRYLEREGV